jgi:import inner membrane translocase subunit TIM17
MVAGGPRSALGSAVACGILLGVFEGVGVLLSRVFSEGTRPQLPQCAYCCLLSTLLR